MKGTKTITLALAAVLAVGIAGAQKTGTAKGGAQKPTNNQPGRIVLGTNQMAGDNGKVGLTYTIGQQQPVNITLTDAKFSVTRFNCGSYALAPNKDEKLLILTYTIHNPNPEVTSYNSGTLKFTAVDQEDVNHEGQGQVTHKDQIENLSVELKPAQKIEVQTAILVPAKGTVPKLIVQHRSGGAVLRYDLRPILKPLPAPFAGEGMDALSEIKADKDTWLPTMYFDAKFLSSAFQERRLGVTTIGDEKVFFLAKFMVKKQSPTGHIIRFRGYAVTEDGDRYETSTIMKGSVDEGASSYTEFGQEVAIRMVVVLPKKAKVTAFRFWEEQGGPSRTYIFPVDAQFSKPEATVPENNNTNSGSQTEGTTQNQVQADEYVSTYKGAKGETAMELSHLEVNNGSERKTEIVSGGEKAILIEDLKSGAVTLHFPGRNETYRAPKAQGKDPQTSLALPSKRRPLTSSHKSTPAA